MERIYSWNTGIYLGLLWQQRLRWYSETRAGIPQRHFSRNAAMERLERQPEHGQDERETAA